MKHIGTIALIMLAVVLCVFSAGYVYASDGRPSDPSSAKVVMKNFAFEPAKVSVIAGGTVTWTNYDGAPHTVKFDGDESRMLSKSESYTKTFNEPGTYDYTCGIHPNMKGAVIVK